MKYKHLILFVLVSLFTSFIAMSQSSYDAAWKKVEDLVEKEGRPQSALAEVQKIYTKAKSEKNDAQLVKSLIYMVQLRNQNRENNLPLSIKELETEIASAKEPARSILHSLVASVYWNYYQQNRWSLYDRTQTTGFVKTDIATWTIEDFHKQITAHYLASLENSRLLKQTKVSAFEPIIIKGNMRHLRPTLYDLLAHHALQYFRNDERDIKKPAYAFEIDQVEAFAPANSFTKFNFSTRDSLSLHHKALEIYQELLAFHLNDKNKEALIDADLERIQFVYSYSTHENKEALYEAALKNIIDKYKGSVSFQAQYLLAMYFHNQAAAYVYGEDSTNHFKRIKAVEILESVVRDSAIKNEGWTNSYNLLNQIKSPSFSFQLERVNLPSLQFRVMVEYMNMETINFRIIKSTEAIRQLLDRGNDKNYWNALLRAPVVKEWEQRIPNPGDYQMHRVEVKADELPLGDYIMVAANRGFVTGKDLLGAQLFHVSNISYINYDDAFFVLHRNTGAPIANAKVSAFERNYDYKTSKYSRTPIGTYTTNAYGLVNIKTKKERNNGFYIDVTAGNDKLSLHEHYYTYRYYNEEKTNAVKRIFFFTDRSIYRPGQTMMFKGIVLTEDKQGNSIAVNHTTKIYLRDANYQVVDSVQLTTNEFGSFSGKFTLPASGLTGQYYIFDKGSRNQHGFSVEEYKRPKFLVEFQPLQQTYKAGDTVITTAIAKAYAGNNITNGKVIYRVVRQPRFPHPWFRSWLPRTEPMEIAHGETETDDEGKFTVSFRAIPDRKIDKKLEPLFDYIVYADVTDINGETRSSQQRITAGYKSLVIESGIPDRAHRDSLNKLNIRTENLNGVFQPSLVNVSFTKLVPEKRLIRERYWEEPDQFIMSKEEYLKHFPNDEYKNETDPENWTRADVVFTHTDSITVPGNFSMNASSIAPGFYELTISTKDKDGNDVEIKEILEVYTENSTPEKLSYYHFRPSGKPVEPGETVQNQLGSPLELFLLRHIDKNKTSEKDFNAADVDQHRISNETKTFVYNATEADRGGYGVHYLFVKHNRFFKASDVIHVPWSNKELDISYSTFRDKTLPGSEETWTLKIKGNKNEKIAAEMLAGMYDASLDQFRMHNWNKPNIYPQYYSRNAWSGTQNFSDVQAYAQDYSREMYRNFKKIYDRLIFGSSYYGSRYRFEEVNVSSRDMSITGNLESRAPGLKAQTAPSAPMESDADGVADTVDLLDNGTEDLAPQEGIQVRTNFNETAFFFPHLRTDADGNIEFSFTMPEALTRWKFLSIAHSKELAFGISQNEIITQKELMVQPNAPRFLRQGDRMEFSTKIVNLSDKEMTGQVQLQLFDASTNQSVDGYFLNTMPNQYFTVAAGQSHSVNFPIQVPYQFNNALTWRVVATSGNFSDGEENVLPVLSNRMLVTETLPLHMRGGGIKEFSFDKLFNAGSSSTLQHHALTIEYTANPTWFAVQALPYLSEYPYDFAEQVWNRYYANALASGIASSSPRIKQIFEQWRGTDTAALISNLQKNQELKSILLEETPWVLAAQSETEQKRNIALLFDMVRMSNELKANLEKLKTLQSSNGGFVWFKGGPDDRYITQYIITGIGHLQKLGYATDGLESIVDAGIKYLDRKILDDHDRLVKSKADLSKQQISAIQVQYLYMRSFFSHNMSAAVKRAHDYYLGQAKKFWTGQGKYLQGMSALALHRSGDKTTPSAILLSLKETSLNDDEMGMYWKDNRFGFSWFWQYAPIETQSLLIEAFAEIKKDTAAVDDMKTWLVKNKQTTHWRTTKATAEAIYAMLLNGSNWLEADPGINISLGNYVVSNTSQQTEAGTGYFKTSVPAKDIKPGMGKIKLEVQQTTPQTTTAPSWGAVYWQYFEDLDKISFAETPLKLSKKLFVMKNTDRGPVLSPVTEGMELKVGDKIQVRIELRTDRDMEYVHMKDMRASSMEPLNVLSGYRWQGGLGYYESTRDASTNFFFNYLPKGTYVFEYSLFVSHKGNFSNGITTIQSMYAPEFSAHSEGVRVLVD